VVGPDIPPSWAYTRRAERKKREKGRRRRGSVNIVVEAEEEPNSCGKRQEKTVLEGLLGSKSKQMASAKRL
jgi:hypothetical protein